MLKAENIRAGYKDLEILNGVTLEMGVNEIVALVGPNGAGKTTLLRVIAGVLSPLSGAIRFLDHDITKLPPNERVRLGIAHVPEGGRIFRDLTVWENLLIGGIVDTKDIFRNQLEKVQALFPFLKQRSRQWASTLSGGEQQMLAIARGLMGNPKLLLLDEPSWGLMPAMVDVVFSALCEIRAEGTSILLAEQKIEKALRLANHAYVLSTGTIVAEGAGEQLLASADFQRAYLGRTGKKDPI